MDNFDPTSSLVFYLVVQMGIFLSPLEKFKEMKYGSC